jgi:hypothetical protein
MKILACSRECEREDPIVSIQIRVANVRERFFVVKA